MKQKYEARVGYPSEYFNAPDAKFNELAGKHSAKFGGSGCGFGQRDLHFTFETKKAADAFVKEAKKIPFDFKAKFYVDKIELDEED